MTVNKVLAVALVGTLLLGSTAWAQEGERPERRERVQRPDQPRGPRRQRPKEFYEGVLARLDLNAEQKARTTQVLETNAQNVANWRNQHAEDLRSLNERWGKARQEEDEKAQKELAAERAKLTKELTGLQEKLPLQIVAVLRGEQKAKFAAQVLGNRRMLPSQAGRARLALKMFDLNSAQTELAEKILERAVAQATKAEDRRGAAAALREAVQEIKSKVLTPGQAEKFDQLLRAGQVQGMLAGLDLTDQQRKQTQEILAEANKKAAEAKPEDRRQIRRDAWSKIRQEVLTDKQREQLQSRRERVNRQRQPARRAGEAESGQQND